MVLSTRLVNATLVVKGIFVPSFIHAICIKDGGTRHLKEQHISLLPKVETGGWTPVKQERATSNVGNLKRSNQIKVSPNHLVGDN